MTILLKKSDKNNPAPLKVRHAAFGHNGYLYIGDYQIGGPRQALANELRRLADAIEPKTVAQQPRRRELMSLPPEMESPETAWPYLVERYPWLFGGLDVSREPYAKYLRAAEQTDDAAAIAHLDNPSQADVAEVLFEDRTKTGGSYRRRILRALKRHTTTTKPATTTPDRLKQAA